MHRINAGGSSRLMASLARRTWLALLASLLGCWLAPALAQAQTVTLGPAMTNAGAEESCPTMPGGGPPVAFPDCAYVNSTEPAGVIAQALADGTITTWRIDGFQGTARLLVLQATGGGGYEVVQRSAATPDEPCVNTGSFCGPSLTPYVFTTNLPIKKGQYLGVEGISGANCNGTPDQPNPCTFIGIGPNGSASEYFDTTPAPNTPTAPSGNDTGRLVNADEVVGKTVSVSLSPATITADGLAQTTATATVTAAGGTPVVGDSVSISSSDGGEQVGPVTDNGDGTYSATITSSETVGMPTVTATDVSDASQPSGMVTLTQSAPTIGVSVKPGVIAADGKATAIATVRLTGVQGEAVPGQSVTIATTGPAAAGPVIDNGDGTYTSVITSTDTPGEVTVTGTDVSVAPSVSAQAQLTTAPKVVSMSLAPAKITADGLATTVATAAVTEDGNPVAGDLVAISSSDGGEKVGAVVDHGDGTYTATITASEAVGTPTVTATDVSDALMPSGAANLTQAPPTIRVSVKPGSITADGKSTATASVKLTGVHGEPVPGQAVSITTAGPAFAGLVRDGGGGTYTARITASHAAGNVTVTGSDTSVDPSVSGHAKLKLKAKKKPAGNCVVPKLAGDTLAAAKRALGKAKCGVGKVTVKKSGKVAKGRVISSSPGAGAHRKGGAAVSLTVSRGKH